VGEKRATGDAEKTQDRQTESGIRCVRHSGGDAQPSLLLFSIIFFIYFAFDLYFYFLNPYSFTIL
jgi:hypothetical protein